MTSSGPEKIQVRAFRFGCRIVKLHGFLYRKGSAARRLANQVLDSGTSIGANLEEADTGQSRNDFISKCNIALKEARETHYWLRLLIASEQVDISQLMPLISEAHEIVAILTTIVRKSRRNSQ